MKSFLSSLSLDQTLMLAAKVLHYTDHTKTSRKFTPLLSAAMMKHGKSSNTARNC